MNSHERYRARKLAVELILIGAALAGPESKKRVLDGTNQAAFTTGTQGVMKALETGSREQFLSWLEWKLEIDVPKDMTILDGLMRWMNDSVNNQWAYDFTIGLVEKIEIGMDAKKIKEKLLDLVERIGDLDE